MRRNRVKTTLLAGAAGLGAAGLLTGLAASAGAYALWNSMKRRDFRGRSVLITGGSRGLGFALAQECVRLGCRVAICARNKDEVDWACESLRRQGSEVLGITCDVTKQEEVEDMVRRATQEFGRIDVLINNAGMISVGPIHSQTIEDFREAMDVMYWAHVYTTMAVLPYMRERGEGYIANVTSIGGKIAVPHLLPYSAAKFAAVGLSEGLTAELAREGIKVTTVVPGLMRTGSHVNALFKGDHRAEYAWFSLSATSPLSAIGAQRAARSIMNAVRRGQPEVVLSIPAKLAVLAHGIAPGTISRALGAVNRVMPGTGNTSVSRHTGKESETVITRSPLTALGRMAGEKLHQFPEKKTIQG